MLANWRSRGRRDEQEYSNSILKWVHGEVERMGYDFSDVNCRAVINPQVLQQKKLIVIELEIVPLVGVFMGISFRPKVILNAESLTHRPRVYNDRRIFHPNISVFSCQIVSPEICLKWNSAQELIVLFRYIKYVILEPNEEFVPYHSLNVRAACIYHYKTGEAYREISLGFNSAYLDREMEKVPQEAMTNEADGEQIMYWTIQSLSRKNQFIAEELEEEIGVLARRLRKVEIQE